MYTLKVKNNDDKLVWQYRGQSDIAHTGHYETDRNNN